MFKCEACGRLTKPREKQFKKVVETRNKEYSNEYIDKYGNEFESKTYGKEIVKELNVCEQCS